MLFNAADDVAGKHEPQPVATGLTAIGQLIRGGNRFLLDPDIAADDQGPIELEWLERPRGNMKAPRTRDFALWQDFGLLVGRMLIGWLFVESGWRKLMGMDAFIASLVSRRVPYATILGWIGAPLEFFGGLALMVGFWTRCATLAIIVFTIVATLIGHRYWEIADAAMRRVQHVQFSKNLAIIGGLVLLAVTGGGRLSVDGWRRR
jgi:putative oxidoreductase